MTLNIPFQIINFKPLASDCLIIIDRKFYFEGERIWRRKKFLSVVPRGLEISNLSLLNVFNINLFRIIDLIHRSLHALISALCLFAIISFWGMLHVAFIIIYKKNIINDDFISSYYSSFIIAFDMRSVFHSFFSLSPLCRSTFISLSLSPHWMRAIYIFPVNCRH